MITVVLASECFAGCSKKTIENSAASNASVLEENEKEAENAKKTENAEEMPEKLKTGNTEEMLENISEDTEKESGTLIIRPRRFGKTMGMGMLAHFLIYGPITGGYSMVLKLSTMKHCAVHG